MTLTASLLLFVTGCDVGPGPKFAREQNPDRMKRLLPIIAEDWSNYNKGNNPKCAAWRTGFDSDSGKPGHSGKQVLYPSGSLESEEDYYYSGRTFTTIDGTSWESVTVHYSYTHPDSPWSCYYIHQGASGDELSLTAAEAILKSWRLERLNYPK